jgi:hypothetical protein
MAGSSGRGVADVAAQSPQCSPRVSARWTSKYPLGRGTDLLAEKLAGSMNKSANKIGGECIIEHWAFGAG